MHPQDPDEDIQRRRSPRTAGNRRSTVIPNTDLRRVRRKQVEEDKELAVLIRMSVQGMDAATYDQISLGLTELVKKQPGFLMHAAYFIDGNLTVGEIWESPEQHQKWFDENVKPNVPGEIKKEVIDIHNLVTP